MKKDIGVSRKDVRQISIPLKGDTHLHEALKQCAADEDGDMAKLGRTILRAYLTRRGYYTDKGFPA